MVVVVVVVLMIDCKMFEFFFFFFFFNAVNILPDNYHFQVIPAYRILSF